MERCATRRPLHDRARGFRRRVSREALERGLSDLVSAVTLCQRQKLAVPSLLLLYAAIDIAGWLDAGDTERSVRVRFTRWVDRYMSPADLGCTALELYAARCGLLHTFTGESDLAERGAVRRLMYAWGNADVEALRDAIRRFGAPVTGAWEAVRVDAILAAFARGLSRFLEELDADPPRGASVNVRAGKFFADIRPPAV